MWACEGIGSLWRCCRPTAFRNVIYPVIALHCRWWLTRPSWSHCRSSQDSSSTTTASRKTQVELHVTRCGSQPTEVNQPPNTIAFVKTHSSWLAAALESWMSTSPRSCQEKCEVCWRVQVRRGSVFCFLFFFSCSPLNLRLSAHRKACFTIITWFDWSSLKKTSRWILGPFLPVDISFIKCFCYSCSTIVWISLNIHKINMETFRRNSNYKKIFWESNRLSSIRRLEMLTFSTVQDS